MLKRNLRDRPKASSLQKKVKQSANVKTAVLDNISNELEVDPELVEEQETGTHGFPLSYYLVNSYSLLGIEYNTDFGKRVISGC
jgi:hypothetical protein